MEKLLLNISLMWKVNLSILQLMNFLMVIIELLHYRTFTPCQRYRFNAILSDDERLIEIYSSQISGLGNVGNDDAMSLLVACDETNEVQSILEALGVTCLSKCDDNEAMLNSVAVTFLCSPEEKVSTNKTFKHA
ncbi:hypothetical protein PIB30_042358, partial [Stylosanthes scabra]|nr:hypothetical protein [Stylosanthes scabra]